MAQTASRLVAGMRKKFGAETALLLGQGGGSGVRAVCPTGVEVLDRWVLGVGGVPYGRIVELYGWEGAGKTSIMNLMLAGVQRDGGIAVLAETEHVYEPGWAARLGVNLDELVLLQPDYLDGEGGALDQIEHAVDHAGGRPMLIALDSVAATQTKAEHEGGVTSEEALGVAARAWSSGLRVLAARLAKSQAALVLVNQVRKKIGVMYGNPDTTPGGNAIRFYASLRLDVRHGKSDGPGGRFMRVKAMKNKVSPPFREAELRLDYGGGFDADWATLNHAKDVGCVEKSSRDLAAARAALGWA